MGFYAKDETSPSACDPATADPQYSPRKCKPENAIRPILSVGVGHRFYSPGLGRWLSKDPIGEAGEDNEYGFVENNGADSCDFLGLYKSQEGCSEEELKKIASAETAAKAAVEQVQGMLNSVGGKYAPMSIVNRYFNQLAASQKQTPKFRRLAQRIQDWHKKTSLAFSHIGKGFNENSYSVRCECCKNEKDVARSPDNRNVIIFCKPTFFDEKRTEGMNAETFLHEMSHRFGHTYDRQGGKVATMWDHWFENAYWIERFATDPDAEFDAFIKEHVVKEAE